MSALPAQPALLALVTLMTLEFLRASGPLLHGTAVLAYAAAALIGVLARSVGSVRAALLATLGLILVRVGVQAEPAPTAVAVAAGAVLGIAATVALASHLVEERGGIPTATAIVVGGALEIGVRTAFGTWDPMWRPGVWPWVFTAAECILAVNLLLTIRRRLLGTCTSPRLGAIGLYLALFVLFLGSPAFVASQSGTTLPAASAVLLLGCATAIPVLRMWPNAAAPVAMVGLAGCVAVAYWMNGPIVIVAVLAAVPLAATLLARVLVPGNRMRGGLALAALLAGLGYAVWMLPIDNRWLVIAAAALGLAGLRTSVRRTGSGLASIATVLAVLLIAGITAVTWPKVPTSTQQGATVRLMTWNVAYGFTDDRAVDLEAVARGIEAASPDIAVLAEVSRGRPAAGGTDMAEWLARRLRMRYVWSPTTDGQTGNLLLTRLPVVRSHQESTVDATLTLDGGRTLHVVGTPQALSLPGMAQPQPSREPVVVTLTVPPAPQT